MLDWVHPSASKASVGVRTGHHTLSLIRCSSLINKSTDRATGNSVAIIEARYFCDRVNSVRSATDRNQRHFELLWVAEVQLNPLTGLPIHCVKTWQSFILSLVSRPLFIIFLIIFFKKNLELIAFQIVCINSLYYGKPDCLVSTTNLTCFKKNCHELW